MRVCMEKPQGRFRSVRNLFLNFFIFSEGSRRDFYDNGIGKSGKDYRNSHSRIAGDLLQSRQCQRLRTRLFDSVSVNLCCLLTPLSRTVVAVNFKKFIMNGRPCRSAHRQGLKSTRLPRLETVFRQTSAFSCGMRLSAGS